MLSAVRPTRKEEGEKKMKKSKVKSMFDFTVFFVFVFFPMLKSPDAVNMWLFYVLVSSGSCLD